MSKDTVYVGIEVPTVMLDVRDIKIYYEDGKPADYDLHVKVNILGLEFRVCPDSLTDDDVDFLVNQKIEQDAEQDAWCPDTHRDYS